MRYLAILNPTAGRGTCAKRARPALEYLQNNGVRVEVVETRFSGHATELTRDAYGQGCRDFLSVGGDGTAHEILNGLTLGGAAGQQSQLALLPFGTGNCFVNDFTDHGVEILRVFRICSNRA